MFVSGANAQFLCRLAAESSLSICNKFQKSIKTGGAWVGAEKTRSVLPSSASVTGRINIKLGPVPHHLDESYDATRLPEDFTSPRQAYWPPHQLRCARFQYISLQPLRKDRYSRSLRCVRFRVQHQRRWQQCDIQMRCQACSWRDDSANRAKQRAGV